MLTFRWTLPITPWPPWPLHEPSVHWRSLLFIGTTSWQQWTLSLLRIMSRLVGWWAFSVIRLLFYKPGAILLWTLPFIMTTPGVREWTLPACSRCVIRVIIFNRTLPVRGKESKYVWLCIIRKLHKTISCISCYFLEPLLIQYIFYLYVHIHCVWKKTLLLFLR